MKLFHRHLFLGLLPASGAMAQTAPVSPDRPWQPPASEQVQTTARYPSSTTVGLDPARTYALAELIDLLRTRCPALSTSSSP
jgi:hypothetical protein